MSLNVTSFGALLKDPYKVRARINFFQNSEIHLEVFFPLCESFKEVELCIQDSDLSNMCCF